MSKRTARVREATQPNEELEEPVPTKKKILALKIY